MASKDLIITFSIQDVSGETRCAAEWEEIVGDDILGLRVLAGLDWVNIIDALPEDVLTRVEEIIHGDA